MTQACGKDANEKINESVKETGISPPLFLWVWRKQAVMLWYIVIHMFMVLSSVTAHGGVCVSNPGPSQAYRVQMKAEKQGCLRNHNLGLCGTIHAGTALWPHSDAQEGIHTLSQADPNLSPSYSTTDTDTLWTSALQLENMNLSPGILLAQSAYKMEWSVWSTGVLGQQTT